MSKTGACKGIQEPSQKGTKVKKKTEDCQEGRQVIGVWERGDGGFGGNGFPIKVGRDCVDLPTPRHKRGKRALIFTQESTQGESSCDTFMCILSSGVIVKSLIRVLPEKDFAKLQR